MVFDGGHGMIFQGQHLTIDQTGSFFTTSGTPDCSIYLTNCVLTGLTGWGKSVDNLDGSHNGFYNSVTCGSDQVPETEIPFAPVGYLAEGQTWYFVANAQGSHYLRTGSPFTDAGTPDISQNLKDELSRGTTVVPGLFNYDVNSSQTLGPAAIRDSDTPDLGYHYPVVDYVVCGATVNNCTLNIDQGTVLAFTTPYYEPGRPEAVRYWDHYTIPSYEWGIRVNPGGRLNVNGVPTSRVVFARLEAVQENPVFVPDQDSLSWCPLITFKGVLTPYTYVPVGPLAEAKIRFADFQTMAGSPAHIANLYPEFDYTYDLVQHLELEDCHFYCGWLVYESGGVPGRTFALRNNVFERTIIDIEDFWSNHGTEPEMFEARNNLFYHPGEVDLVPTAGANWKFTDNIFDHASLDAGWNGPVAENHHNAYIGMSTRLSPAAPISTDPDLASLSYETGPLGSFYLPASSTALVDKGSRTAADAGLYHFTSFTSNVKEGNEAANPKQVNIGPHYLALTSGRPADSNNDGVADFLADRNGDSVQDTDEMPWSSANNGSLTILTPVNNATVSGLLKLRIYLGNLGTGAPQPYVLYTKVGGTIVPHSTYVLRPAESVAEVEIDTRQLSNEEHAISVTAFVQTASPGPDGGSGQEVADSPEILVNVVNDIRFPAWEDMSQVAFKVNLETPNVTQDYTVWFFGPDYPTSYDPFPINAHQGNSSGNISFTETLGNLGYGDGSTDPSLYSVTELAAQNTARINPITRNDPTFPGVGRWVVTYELDPVDAEYYYNGSSHTYDLGSNILDPLNDFDARWMHDVGLGGWIACGVLSGAPDSPLITFPQPGGSSPQTWPTRNRGQVGEVGKADRRLVAKYIGRPDVRNLYALAHGPSEQDMILPLEIRPSDVEHRYRFVFLDGCETAAAYVMRVFGASATELHLPSNPSHRTLGFLSDLGFPGNTGPIQIDYYVNFLRPSAFLGWNVKWPIAFPLSVYGKTPPQNDPWTGLPCNKQIYAAIANWQRQAVFFWTLNNKTIVEALRDATDLAYVPGTGSGDLEVFSHINVGPFARIGPDRPEYYFDGPRQNLALFGHGGLKFNAWNHGADGVPTSP